MCTPFFGGDEPISFPCRALAFEVVVEPMDLINRRCVVRFLHECDDPLVEFFVEWLFALLGLVLFDESCRALTLRSFGVNPPESAFLMRSAFSSLMAAS